jgi:hypothetical protein
MILFVQHTQFFSQHSLYEVREASVFPFCGCSCGLQHFGIEAKSCSLTHGDFLLPRTSPYVLRIGAYVNTRNPGYLAYGIS